MSGLNVKEIFVLNQNMNTKDLSSTIVQELVEIKFLNVCDIVCYYIFL